MMGKVTLVLGGTKSGKTGWAQMRAQELSLATGKTVGYIATALPFDEGMKLRISKHQASRPSHWQTFEESRRVSSILAGASEGKAVLILDCLTLLATNIILEMGDEPDREEAQEAVLTEVSAILEEAEKLEAELIIISNYVEAGLVAPTRLGGIFQDIAGLCHQSVARKAEQVIYMVAGIPQCLK
jgi:adenosylcobinamide kinase / adenosylcobinamide-phosphate guanylyltransferase